MSHVLYIVKLVLWCPATCLPKREISDVLGRLSEIVTRILVRLPRSKDEVLVQGHRFRRWLEQHCRWKR